MIWSFIWYFIAFLQCVGQVFGNKENTLVILDAETDVISHLEHRKQMRAWYLRLLYQFVIDQKHLIDQAQHFCKL